MTKQKTQKWILSFFALVLAILMLISGIVYVIDPFFQFRVKDNAYKLSGWFVSSGLIKNYEYDTLIIGSSMTQNFNMDVFRKELGVNPLHIGLGDIRPIEMKKLISAAYNADKADTYYICVDINFFSDEHIEESRYPQYLLDNDPLSRLRYFFSYEVWFRYIPVDLGLLLADALGVELPQKFAESRNIDKLEDWSSDFSFSEDAVLGSYSPVPPVQTLPDNRALYEMMAGHADQFLENFDFDEGQHIFYFPPYSALAWCDLQSAGRLEAYLQAKEYFVKNALELGAQVYDFQAADFTLDLNNYSDIKHHSPQINDWIVAQFADGTYRLDSENCADFQDKLRENTDSFRAERADLFSK